jgi:predicted metal-binding protein
MNKELFQKDLISTALSMGASDAKIFQIDNIAFDSRTLLKCLFGCPGGMHYCPDARDASSLIDYSGMIKNYDWGVLICTDDLSKGQEITLALESKAFLAGYYFAFGATECAHCERCSYEENKPCVDREKQRPPLYTLGIDVYKTARGLGLELNVVQKEGDPARNITAVFVE